MENVLEKILEEIEDHAIEFKSFGMCDDYVSVGWAKDIIRSHMGDVPKCRECSRRKFYMQGYEDGKKNDGWIPVSEKLPEDGVKHFSTENIQSQMRAAKLSNRMLTTGKSILRAIRDETTGEYAWFDDKYLKMFDGCTPNLIKYQGNSEYYDAVFTRYGEIIGIILPVRVSEW